MTTAYSRSAIALLSSVLAAAVLGTPHAASAKDCGGAIECVCGDVVVEAATLDDDLNGCRNNGLTLAAGVALDCDGRQISGPGSSSRWDGVRIAGSGAEVRNCRIRSFGRGVYVDGEDDSQILDNQIFGNQIGIQVGRGAERTRIEGNEVRENTDEGVHLGAGSADASVTDNHVWANALENVYLISTAGNHIEENVIDAGREAAILLKHANDNLVARNSILDRSILLRGDSFANTFTDNDLESGGFGFIAIEDELGWTYPHDNHVTGGQVLKASTCFRFLGASNNTVREVVVDRCRVVDEKPVDALQPHDNSVEVIQSALIEPDDAEPACSGCQEAEQDVARLRFEAPSEDRLKFRWSFETTMQFDPSAHEIEVVFATSDGPVMRVLIPPGRLTSWRRSFRYRRGSGEAIEGLRRFWLEQIGPNAWSIRVGLESDLADADRSDLILRWQIGDEAFVIDQPWSQSRRGWRTRRTM